MARKTKSKPSTTDESAAAVDKAAPPKKQPMSLGEFYDVGARCRNKLEAMNIGVATLAGGKFQAIGLCVGETNKKGEPKFLYKFISSGTKEKMAESGSKINGTVEEVKAKLLKAN